MNLREMTKKVEAISAVHARQNEIERTPEWEECGPAEAEARFRSELMDF